MESRQLAFLVTHQLRLRDVNQITGHNITPGDDDEPPDGTPIYYYTLHKNADPVPLFTSAECSGHRAIPPTTLQGPDSVPENNDQPVFVDWPKLKKDFAQDSPLKSIVARLWLKSKSTEEGEKSDKSFLCLGIHFNGLVQYSKELRLKRNSLVFHTRAGCTFTCPDSIDWQPEFSNTPQGDQQHVDKREEEAPDMVTSLALIRGELYSRYNCVELSQSCETSCCSLDQLLKLQQSQLRLKYKRELLQSLIMEIQSKSAVCIDERNPLVSSSSSSISMHYYRRDHHPHQGGGHHGGSMGKTLTRLLNMEPERVDPKTLLEAFKLRKSIEAVRVRCRLLAIERDRARKYVDGLQRQREKHCDRNVETDSMIMANYHAMSKEKEQYLHLKLTLTKNLETLMTTRGDWRARKQILLRLINEIYDIREHEGGRYTINSISLPDAEGYEDTHVPATSISVALGYVAHIVQVTSNVLAVPLRNSIIFKGSQSQIAGQLQMLNKNVFPLYCRVMPPSEETKYAIFLLNQNLTQLLVAIGQWPTDLRATLANLMSLTKKCQLLETESMSMHRTPYIYSASVVSSSELDGQGKGGGIGSPDHRKVSWAEEVEHR